MRRILVTAYDIDPYKGSESGMGWNFVYQISRQNEVIAITRKNNGEKIKKYMAENNLLWGRLTFKYYDLPYWLRFWKKGGRGSSLYFYLWQILMPVFIKGEKIEFDIAHNLNFHADWAPSMLWVFRKPFVWGPIGHHGKIPSEFILGPYGFSEYVRDRLKWAFKRVFWAMDPFLKLTKAKADVVLCMNSSVKRVLKLGGKSPIIFPSVGTSNPSIRALPRPGRFRVLSVGRFVPLKGFDLTLKAFIAFYEGLDRSEKPGVELMLVGKGPAKEALLKLCPEAMLETSIRFIDWMEKKDLASIYADSDLFLFPSHEGAGMVVAEALSYGLPVVCLKNDGPGEFIDESAGIRVEYGSYPETVKGLAEALKTLFRDESKRRSLGEGALNLCREKFDWDAKGRFLETLYTERF